MSEPMEDGRFFTVDGVEYFYDGGEVIEIADSYPDMETALRICCAPSADGDQSAFRTPASRYGAPRSGFVGIR